MPGKKNNATKRKDGVYEYRYTDKNHKPCAMPLEDLRRLD